jgi:hypothetical protein
MARSFFITLLLLPLVLVHENEKKKVSMVEGCPWLPGCAPAASNANKSGLATNPGTNLRDAEIMTMGPFGGILFGRRRRKRGEEDEGGWLLCVVYIHIYNIYIYIYIFPCIEIYRPIFGRLAS